MAGEEIVTCVPSRLFYDEKGNFPDLFFSFLIQRTLEVQVELLLKKKPSYVYLIILRWVQIWNCKVYAILFKGFDTGNNAVDYQNFKGKIV